jgi:transposase
MRRSFDGLCGSVESLFHGDPLSGHLFVFFNRRRTMVKMLFWENGGFWIYAKRLEQGTFCLRSITSNGEIDMTQLLCLLDGIDLSGSRRRKRFSLPRE